MVKRDRNKGGKCTGAGHQTTRILSQDGLKICTRVDNSADFSIEDVLDFEPEDEDNECVTDIQKNITNFLNEQSSLIYQNSDESTDQTMLPAHRGEMISFSYPYTADREKCYFKITPSVATTRTFLDSSSSSSSSGGSDSSSSSSISNEEDTSQDEKKSEEELEQDTVDNKEETVDTETPNIFTSPVFRDKKVVVTNSNNIMITAFSSRPAKRKWNRAFQSDSLSTPLYLEDIGYVSHAEFSDSGSETASTAGSNSILKTTLKVTVNSSSERICQEVGKMIDVSRYSDEFSSPDKSIVESSHISPDDTVRGVCRSPDAKYQTPPFGKPREPIFSRPTLSPFKMPLPLAKRPPSRPRKSDTLHLSNPSQNSVASNPIESRPLVVKQNVIQTADFAMQRIGKMAKDDDMMSIVASTLGNGDNLENLDNLTDDLSNPDDFEEEVDEEEERYSHEQDYSEDNKNREYVEKWIESTHQPDRVPSPRNIEPKSSPAVTEKSSVTLKATPNKNGTLRIDFRTVPKFFSSLCFHRYFGNGCTKTNCALFHFVRTEKFTARCKEISPNELLDCYAFTLRFHMLLQEIYHCFLEGFAFHKMESKLISVISDYLSPSLVATINPVEALQNVIKALEKTGLKFEDAVEKISFNVGFLNYPILADILLDVISQKANMSEYWEEMKRICRASGRMPPKIVERILAKLTSVCPLDKRLCTDVYNFIVKENRTELGKVRKELLQPFETLVNFGGGGGRSALSEHIDSSLSREREIFESCVATPTPRVDVEVVGVARRSSKASSTASSSRSSVGSREVNKYVPEAAVGRLVAPPQQVSSATNGLTPPPPPPPVTPPLSIFPKQPILGFTRYRSDFRFNESLHNLLVAECREHIVIHESDIALLDRAIRERDGGQFSVLLDNYKYPVTVANFITMTIANLLGTTLTDCCAVLHDLLKSIARLRPDFFEKNRNIIKGCFEVVVFNLLFEIEKRGLWKEGGKLLKHFCDWDSLISSQKFRHNLLSPMGRYIFLAKILVKSNTFDYAFEILQCPSLHLLEKPSKWPLFNSPYFDMESRNAVLEGFLSAGYRHNVVVVAAFYENVFKNGELFGYDAYSKFNSMMRTLIDEERFSSLKRFVFEWFYSRMDKSIFRAFVILMAEEVRIEDAFKLYENGCQRNIYVPFTGRERRIFIRTNMSDSEIRLVLKYYFRKLYERESSPFQLGIDIKLPETPVPDYPFLQRYIRSIVNINNSLRRILKETFCMAANTTHVNSTEILLDADEIGNWLSRQLY